MTNTWGGDKLEEETICTGTEEKHVQAGLV